MRSLIIGIAVVALLAMPALADVWDGDPDGPSWVQPSVGFSVNIVPWVQITLDDGPLVIDIPAGGNSGSAYVGGNVKTNVDVTLSATIEAYPVMLDGAGNDRSGNATWKAEISEPMQFCPAGSTWVDDDLLTVSVTGISKQVIAGNLTGGIVTITVIPAQ